MRNAGIIRGYRLKIDHHGTVEWSGGADGEALYFALFAVYGLSRSGPRKAKSMSLHTRPAFERGKDELALDRFVTGTIDHPCDSHFGNGLERRRFGFDPLGKGFR